MEYKGVEVEVKKVMAISDMYIGIDMPSLDMLSPWWSMPPIPPIDPMEVLVADGMDIVLDIESMSVVVISM